MAPRLVATRGWEKSRCALGGQDQCRGRRCWTRRGRQNLSRRISPNGHDATTRNGGAVARPCSSPRPVPLVPVPLSARNAVPPTTGSDAMTDRRLASSTIQAGPGLKWFLLEADDGPRRLSRLCRLCPCPSGAVKRMSALLSLSPGWPSGLPSAVMHVVVCNGPAARRNFER